MGKKCLAIFVLIAVLWNINLSAVETNLPDVKKVAIGKNNELLVNGAPFLPLNAHWSGHYHKGHQAVSKQGFNVFEAWGSTPEGVKEDLDTGYQNGLRAFVSLIGISDNLPLIEKIVLANRDHPALLCWDLEDEANAKINGAFKVSPEVLQKVYDLIKKLDPNHPVMLNLTGMGDFFTYRNVTDIMSCDPYPLPGYAITDVARIVDSAVKGVDSQKPVFCIVQMFKDDSQTPGLMENENRAPTPTEEKCMVYLAVTRGATGFGFFSYNQLVGKDLVSIAKREPALWASIKDLLAEVKSLSPVLLSKTSEKKVSVRIVSKNKTGENGYSPVYTILKEYQNKLYLIAVNSGAGTTAARFAVSEAGDFEKGGMAEVLSEGRKVKIAPGFFKGNVEFQDVFKPYQVHIYRIDIPDDSMLTVKESNDNGLRTVELENNFLKVTIAPDIDGRMIEFINKATGRNELYLNQENLLSKTAQINCGGLKDLVDSYGGFNWPGSFFGKKYDYKIIQDNDRTGVLVTASEGSVKIEREMSIYRGSSRLNVKVKYTNIGNDEKKFRIKLHGEFRVGGNVAEKDFIYYPDGNGLNRLQLAKEYTGCFYKPDRGWWACVDEGSGEGVVMSYNPDEMDNLYIWHDKSGKTPSHTLEFWGKYIKVPPNESVTMDVNYYIVNKALFLKKNFSELLWPILMIEE